MSDIGILGEEIEVSVANTKMEKTITGLNAVTISPVAGVEKERVEVEFSDGSWLILPHEAVQEIRNRGEQPKPNVVCWRRLKPAVTRRYEFSDFFESHD